MNSLTIDWGWKCSYSFVIHVERFSRGDTGPGVLATPTAVILVNFVKIWRATTNRHSNLVKIFPKVSGTASGHAFFGGWLKYLLHRVVRYEDISASPRDQTREILKFFNFALTPEVTKFLDTHTNANKGGVSSTYRDSKTAPFHWKQDLNFSDVATIQEKCSRALTLWRYRIFKDKEEMSSQHSVLPLRSFWKRK